MSKADYTQMLAEYLDVDLEKFDSEEFKESITKHKEEHVERAKEFIVNRAAALGEKEQFTFEDVVHDLVNGELLHFAYAFLGDDYKDMKKLHLLAGPEPHIHEIPDEYKYYQPPNIDL